MKNKGTESESVLIIAFCFMVALFMIGNAISGNAQSVTCHPDTVEDKQTIPDLWLLTDSLRLIVKQSSNPVESIEAIHCAKWIEYRIALYPGEPRGDVWNYNEWRVRTVIDNSKVFDK